MGTQNIHDAFARETLSYKDLSAYFSDVVYECSYKGSLLKIVLLFEHKSFVPVFPYSQLLQYILNIWKRALKQNKRIPIVLPIILYHGQRKWKSRPLHAYLSGDTDLFARFIPGFEYILVDLSKIPDKQKIDHAAILRKIPMLHVKAKEVIMTTAEKLRKQGKQEGLEEGEKIGEQRGEKKAKIEDARRMLEKGYPIDDICEITGLSRAEVEELKQ